MQRPCVFRPPTRVQVVGSCAVRAAVRRPQGEASNPSRSRRCRRPALMVDVALAMPAACFDSKDQLNHR